MRNLTPRRRPRAWRLAALCTGTLCALLAGARASTPVRAAPGQTMEPRVYLPVAVQPSGHSATPAPTTAASPTPTLDEPTATETVAPTATDTVEPSPTATAAPTETPTATPVPPPFWLGYVNEARARSGLAPVTEDPDFSASDVLHSRYMVKNDVIGHSETPGNPWYSAEGDAAAKGGNVFGSSLAGMTPDIPIDMWLTGPFHMVGVMDPELAVSGYGDYSEEIGSIHFAATLDVNRGAKRDASHFPFPVKIPGADTTSPYLAYWGGEFPDPLESCPGYSTPSGPPIAVMLGTGDVTPSVTASSFHAAGGPDLPHCVFDETNYKDGANQQLGRLVLGARDAVILMPKSQLAPNTTYTVSFDVNGDHIEWSFTTAAGARRTAPMGILGLPPLPRRGAAAARWVLQ